MGAEPGRSCDGGSEVEVRGSQLRVKSQHQVGALKTPPEGGKEGDHDRQTQTLPLGYPGLMAQFIQQQVEGCTPSSPSPAHPWKTPERWILSFPVLQGDRA